MGEHREPNGGTYEPAFGPEEQRIADPQILYCVTIHDPTEMQLALLVADGAVHLWKAEIGVPTADKSIKCLRFFAKRRIGIRRSQDTNHGLSRREVPVRLRSSKSTNDQH